MDNTDADAREGRRIRDPRRRPLINYNYASLLNKLYNSKARLFSEVAKELGLSPEVLRKKFYTLKKKGFILKPQFNHFKLGLFKAIVFLKEDMIEDINELKSQPFIRSISKLEPGNRYMLVYFIPDFALEEFNERISSDFPDVDFEIILFNEGSMADFVKYGVSINGICSDESLAMLASRVLEAVKMPEETFIGSVKRERFDSLDLAIMAYLENHLAARYGDIARVLGVPERKVKKHYEKHVRRVFEGYRLAGTPFRGNKALALIGITHDDYDVLLSVARVLQRYPLVAGLSITDRKRLYAVVGGPYDCILGFMEYVGRVLNIESAHGLKILSTFTVPYKKYIEYDPRVGWNV